MQYKEYLDDVCKEIRFKAARKVLRKELAAHIDDKKTEFEKNGMQDAEAQALTAMGDAQETGRALNAIHKPRTAWGVIICTILLILAGLAIQVITNSNDRTFGYFDFPRGKQIIVIVMLLCAIVGMYFFDYSLLTRLRYVLYGLALILVSVYSATDNWMGLFSQTGTIAICSFFFLLSIIGFVEKAKGKGILGLVLVCVLCAASLIVIMLVPAFSSVLILVIVFMFILGFAIFQKHFAKSKQWLYFLIVLGILVIVFTLIMIFFLTERWLFGLNLGVDHNKISVLEMLKGAQFIG